MAKFNRVGLMTTDLHLTDAKEDEYRFGLFDWIIKKYQHKVPYVFILGDLTDKKNFHSDRLVRRIADCIHELALSFTQVLILEGNHDYDADPNTPFFGFLDKIPNVRYYSRPDVWYGTNHGWDTKVLFLPHTRNPGRGWNLKSHKNLGAVCLHQTFNGAESESGHELSGISTAPFRHFSCPIFSGDIHKPQKVGPITYIGSPYHVRFGDNFEPRVLVLDREFNYKTARFPAPRKFSIDLVHGKELDSRVWRRRISEGDMAKIRIHLPKSELGMWPKERDDLQKAADKLGLKLCGVTLKELGRDNVNERKSKPPPKKRSRDETYDTFCKRSKLGKSMSSTGKLFME